MWTTIMRKSNTADQSVWAECHASTTTTYIPVLQYSHTGMAPCPGSLDQLIASGAVSSSILPSILYSIYISLLYGIGYLKWASTILYRQ